MRATLSEMALRFVLPAGVCKGTGVERLLEQIGVPKLLVTDKYGCQKKSREITSYG